MREMGSKKKAVFHNEIMSCIVVATNLKGVPNLLSILVRESIRSYHRCQPRANLLGWREEGFMMFLRRQERVC